MLRLLSLAVAVVAMAAAPHTDHVKWTVDKSHTKVGFSVSHLTISQVEGHFDEFDFNLVSHGDDFTGAHLQMSVQVASINTRIEKRDDHLRSADYFEVEKYPTMTFQSTSITMTTEGKYKLKGNLTMHGVTKEMTFDADVKMITSPWTKKPVAGVTVTGEVNRKDFGVGMAVEDAAVGDIITLQVNAEFNRN